MSFNPYDIVRTFEREVAELAGAAHAVAVDTGTAALFLCLQYVKPQTVKIPRRTYPSVAAAVLQSGAKLVLDDRQWEGDYWLLPTPIVDSACRFREGMHSHGSYRCLSFDTRKHLPIGRGGMILCDDAEAAAWFRRARFHGRREVRLEEDPLDMAGWPFVFDPERAARGLMLLWNHRPGPDEPDLQFDYPDLAASPVYGRA